MSDILERLRMWGGDYTGNNPDCEADCAEGADEIERLRKERQWIATAERLPEDDLEMVLLTDGEWVTFGQVNHTRDGWNVREDAEASGPRPLERFTHWMPLPAPPTDGE